MSKLDYIISESNTEIVRKQISAILADELQNQVALIKAKSNPETHETLLLESIPKRVYDERFVRQSGNEDSYLNVILVNNPLGELTGYEQQTDVAKFNIEYYTSSKDCELIDGDTKSSMKLQRCLMACRHILMSANYDTLGLPLGIIGSIIARNLQILQPDNGVDSNYTINGFFTLDVKILEIQNRIEGISLFGNDTTHRLYDTDKGYYYST